MLSMHADDMVECYFEEMCFGTICVSPKLCKKSKEELTSEEKIRINNIRLKAGLDPIEFEVKDEK